MTSQLTPTSTTETNDPEVWIPAPPPTDLIFDDGVPLESNRHRIAMNVLIASLHEAIAPREDYFTGGNMFVYYSTEQIRNRDFRGPDFFAVLNVDGNKERQGWVVWEEGGKYPDVIVELMSPSTAGVDVGSKKMIYEQIFNTKDYFVYDPFDANSLRGWGLNQRKYEELEANPRGWLWCETLGLWLGTWEGTILRETAHWLRFYNREGKLVPLPEEREREDKERERQRADRALASLEVERQEKAQERQRAEQAEAALEEERRKQQALIEKLKAMGIEPENL